MLPKSNAKKVREKQAHLSEKYGIARLGYFHMALDATRNWSVSMAENLKQIKRGKASKQVEISSSTVSYQPLIQGKWTSPPVHLPGELVNQIVECVVQLPEAQVTLASCCLLSHQWYQAALPFLYQQPFLYGANFELFVRTMCPSKNAHVRKSAVSKWVRVLNMANLVHQGSRSQTARLLGRTKGNLEEFVAPQASFALNCLAALSKCQGLRVLDLSLVSESPLLPDLFRTITHMEDLITFRLPRSSGFGVHHNPAVFDWPSNLQNLTLSGGIDGHFIDGIIAFPQSLRNLTIEHCPQARGRAITHLLRTAVRPLRNLRTLKIRHMPQLSSHALNDLLILLPQLEKLSVSVDYITTALFDEAHFHHHHNLAPVFVEEVTGDAAMDSSMFIDPLRNGNLRVLELTSSDIVGKEEKISPLDMLIALDEGALPKLRQVRVARSLQWQSTPLRTDTELLIDTLQRLSWGDWMRGAGAFEGVQRKNVESMEWEDVAGVWTFEG